MSDNSLRRYINAPSNFDRTEIKETLASMKPEELSFEEQIYKNLGLLFGMQDERAVSLLRITQIDVDVVIAEIKAENPDLTVLEIAVQIIENYYVVSSRKMPIEFMFTLSDITKECDLSHSQVHKLYTDLNTSGQIIDSFHTGSQNGRKTGIPISEYGKNYLLIKARERAAEIARSES